MNKIIKGIKIFLKRLFTPSKDDVFIVGWTVIISFSCLLIFAYFCYR